MGNVFGLKRDPRIKGSCALCRFPISDDPEVQAQQQTCRCGPVGRKMLPDVWPDNHTTFEPTGNPAMSQPRCQQCKMRATCDLLLHIITEWRPEKDDEQSGGRIYFGVLWCDDFEAVKQPDIVDGKATRDLKKGETIIVDLHELESLRYRPEPTKADGGPQ